MNTRFDFIIIGGGIVGLSTARQLQQAYPSHSVLVLEKASEVGFHQTGHNSGVIHAGVYYPPDSLKAQFCREGVDATLSFCAKHSIPVEQCGKLLVATNDLEASRMHELYLRCQRNQLDVELLNAEQLRRREPHISGVGAIWVKTTGIVNYQQITKVMAQEFVAAGGQLRLNTAVTGITETANAVDIHTPSGSMQCDYLIACAGLQADRLARLQGLIMDFQIIPFRGEYYQLPASKSQLIKHLIYPIPDPSLPFLGVHLTRMIDGRITVGPNAVVGWKREGYAQGNGHFNISLQDTATMLSFRGFWKFLAQHWRSGLSELKNSISKRGYLKLAQKYCPSLRLDDLQPYPAGIRAQAIMKDGTLVHDFLFKSTPRSLHVCNAPSPAATSAIPIGAHIVQTVKKQWSPQGKPNTD